MKYFIRFGVVLLLTVGSCIQPYNIDVETQDALVVDGLITNQPGPYTVKISKTSALRDQLDKIIWVQGASVSILDEQSNEADLKEVTPGNYQTDSLFLGIVGRIYHLRFMTSEGDLYQSTPEKLLPVGDIDSLFSNYVQKGDDYYLDPFQSVNGFSVHLNGKVLPEQQGLVRWRWTGTFYIRAYPQEKRMTAFGFGGRIIKIPEPVKCSGFIYAGSLIYVFPCTCCYCWITQYNDNVLTSDMQLDAGNSVTQKDIAFISATRRTFYGRKYHLQVDQMSVSQETYNFWRRVEIQQASGSNLFQTPPPTTAGNIQMISGNLPALGIFSASSIKSKTLIFTSDDVPYTLLPIDTIFDSCTKAYPYATTTKPTFW